MYCCNDYLPLSLVLLPFPRRQREQQLQRDLCLSPANNSNNNQFLVHHKLSDSTGSFWRMHNITQDSLGIAALPSFPEPLPRTDTVDIFRESGMWCQRARVSQSLGESDDGAVGKHSESAIVTALCTAAAATLLCSPAVDGILQTELSVELRKSECVCVCVTMALCG